MPSLADDERAGRLLREIRRRGGLTQEQLATRARVPRRDVMRIESGGAGHVVLDRVRATFEAAGARCRLGVWWAGAAADRLLDERHAALVERVVTILGRRGWHTVVEASFSEFGERGSIDVLGVRPTERAVALCEIKSEFGSIEETNRVLDVKERLIPKIVEDRFGWRPAVVGRLLVVPSTDSIRRIVARHEQTMEATYPARSRDVRRWLRTPAAPIRGLWFLAEVPERNSAKAARG